MSKYIKGPEKFSVYFEKITKGAFKNHGFANLKIINNWQQIVGTALSNACWPEKVQFPFGDTRRGTLYITVSNPGLALSIKAQEARIIQKISTYFGYQAISGIRINISKKVNADTNRQVQDDKEIRKQKLSNLELREVNTSIEEISDTELKSSIKSLFKSIFEEKK